MKGLNKVNRTAASTESLLDPLSVFVQQTNDPKEDGFTVIDSTNSSEVLASPNPTHLGRTTSKGNGSVDRPSSLTSFSNSFNNIIRQAIPTSLSPMRGSEPPSTSPVIKKESPTRNQRGSVVEVEDYDERIPLLSGETRIMALIDSSTHVIGLGMITGTLFMTNYRIVFIPSKKEAPITNPSIASWLNIPLGSIDKLEKEKKSKDILGSSNPNISSGNALSGIQIVIYCKDCRQIRINIRGKSTSNGDYELERAFSLMSAYAFPNDVRHLFSYTHHYSKRRLIDLKGEYERIGVLTKYTHIWKASDANNHFRLCSSYPELLIVPQEIKDDELSSVASFRSGQRIPTLTWCNRSTGATLWRSSQPKAGVSGTCSQDEKFIDAIAKSNSYNKHVYDSQPGSNNEPFLFIVDCRSRTSAMANRAAGAGYESQASYPNTRLEFYNIPNIHAVRDSYKSLVSIILNPSATPSSDINFTKQIEDTQWLTNIRLILKASWDTATTILRGCPVLVHCSHGWDRTAQVCALAELMLDPYYRTIKGFIVLLEKDWLVFGHPFKMRCGHGADKQTRQEEEISPIFLQFLDCVWQFIKQYSYHFEFNSQFILTIADHIYSCRFSNFIFSCEQQRVSFIQHMFYSSLMQLLAF